MLTRPRRTREYTGPTPHSVAIQVSFFTVPSIFRLKIFDSKFRPKIFDPKFWSNFWINYWTKFLDQIVGPNFWSNFWTKFLTKLLGQIFGTKFWSNFRIKFFIKLFSWILIKWWFRKESEVIDHTIFLFKKGKKWKLKDKLHKIRKRLKMRLI